MNETLIKKLCALAFFFTGFGITIHAVASELYYKGGYSEILSIQGEWIGLAIMVIAFIISITQLKWNEEEKTE